MLSPGDASSALQRILPSNTQDKLYITVYFFPHCSSSSQKNLHARSSEVHHFTLLAIIVTVVGNAPTVKCNSTVFRKQTKKFEFLELVNTTAHDTSHLSIRGRIPQLRTSRQPAPSSSSSTYLPPDDDEDGEMSPKVASATITTDSIITMATFCFTGLFPRRYFQLLTTIKALCPYVWGAGYRMVVVTAVVR
jgi:hypothetical protein